MKRALLFAALLTALSIAGATAPPSPEYPNKGVAVFVCGKLAGASVLIDGKWEHYPAHAIENDVDVQNRVKTAEFEQILLGGKWCKCFADT